MIDGFLKTLGDMFGSLLGLDARLAPIYLLITIFIGFILWLKRGRETSFAKWLLPREVYLHKSNIVDIQVFLLNLVLGAMGLFAAVTLTPVITALGLHALLNFTSGVDGYTPQTPTLARSALATLVMILTLDFCKYWAHRIHHENRVLWPFHALHHSAEIMTPLTANRNHPVFLVIRSLIYSVIVGSVQALMLFLLIGQIDLITIGGANVGYVMFNALGSNLRHSHIWLSYGPVLEHIFISPAQHHIHHSIEKKHHNKNYGEIFAFWDLMFGSLYVIREYEKLTFGIADRQGNLIKQPHPTLRAAILHPFVESWEQLIKGTSFAKAKRPKPDPARDAEPRQDALS